MSFTPRQRELIEVAKKKGLVTQEDVNAIFSSPISRKANLERFIALGILTPNLQFNAHKLKEIEKT